MSTSFITSGVPGPIDDFVASVTRRFDTNADGNLSTAEFTGFLKQFLGSQSVTSDTPPLSRPGALGSGESRPVVGTMAGFNESKLADSANLSFKYQIGRILQYYPNTAAGLRAALPEIQQIVPGAKIVGDDTIDFGDYQDPKSGRIGAVDVIQAVHGDRGGVAWQWMPVE